MQHSFLSFPLSTYLSTFQLFNENFGFRRPLRLWILNCIISRVLIWIASWSIKKRAVIWPLGFFKSTSLSKLHIFGESKAPSSKVSIWRCVRREDICKSRNYSPQHMSDTALKNCQVEEELRVFFSPSWRRQKIKCQRSKRMKGTRGREKNHLSFSFLACSEGSYSHHSRSKTTFYIFFCRRCGRGVASTAFKKLLIADFQFRRSGFITTKK